MSYIVWIDENNHTHTIDLGYSKEYAEHLAEISHLEKELNMSGFSTKKDYNGFTAIKEGTHIAYITKAVLGQSRKGDDMLTLRWHITEGQDRKRQIRDWIVLVEKGYGYGRLAELCTAIGVLGVGDDPSGLNPHDQESVHDNLLGKQCTITTSNEANGEYTNTRIDAYTPHPDGTGAPAPQLPEDALADFDGMPVGKVSDSDAAEASSSFNNDDLPF